MSRTEIVTLVYHCHNPIDLILDAAVKTEIRIPAGNRIPVLQPVACYFTGRCMNRCNIVSEINGTRFASLGAPADTRLHGVAKRG
jgi:hypothetical protein